MARNDSLETNIVRQNGRKVLIKKVTLATSGTLTTIGTTDIDGNALPEEFDLLIQGSQDFNYSLEPASTAATRVTVDSGSRPGVTILQNQQEAVIPMGKKWVRGQDTKIDHIALTTAGVLKLFYIL
jgi:hypothetical protein